MSAAADAVLDGVALERLRRLGGNSLMGRMIDLFLAGAALRMESVRAGTAAADLPTVARAVHSLKSSAANLGAHRLATLAEEIEILATAGDGTAVADRLPVLELAFAAAGERLSHEREVRSE